MDLFHTNTIDYFLIKTSLLQFSIDLDSIILIYCILFNNKNYPCLLVLNLSTIRTEQTRFRLRKTAEDQTYVYVRHVYSIHLLLVSCLSLERRNRIQNTNHAIMSHTHNFLKTLFERKSHSVVLFYRF